MKIKEIIQIIQEHAPPAIQESYDNSGLITGDPEAEVQALLICLDVTEAVIDEAIAKNCQLVISHHPLVFKGLKQISTTDTTGRILIRAIRSEVAIYAAHTNLDKVIPGVSSALADRLGLINQRILSPDSGQQMKLVTFVPLHSVDAVSSALFELGAGKLGQYDSCSFSSQGTGTFRALDGADPFVGKKGQLHREPEARLELLVHKALAGKVLQRLSEVHPYEEVAYDLLPLENLHPYQGLGIVGDLEDPMDEMDFLNLVKVRLNLTTFRYTALTGRKVTRVSLCGGSGAEFLPAARRSGAQVFISSDFKYHQYFDAGGEIVILDIGHYESEVYAIELLKDIVTKKITTFAVHLSDVNTNPIKYF